MAALLVFGSPKTTADPGSEHQGASAQVTQKPDVPATQMPSGLRVDLLTEVIGAWDFKARLAPPADAIDEVRLERADLGARLSLHELVGGTVSLEAIRSAQPDSLLGIAGDSILPRFRLAEVFLKVPLLVVDLSARAGLIGDPWIDTLEEVYVVRTFGATLAQRSGFFERSDLGILVSAAWPLVGEVALMASNGEGNVQPERNRQKDIALRLSLQPVQIDVDGSPLVIGLSGLARRGFRGPGSADNDRLAVALLLSHDAFHAGVDAALARGLLSRSDVVAYFASAFSDFPLGPPGLHGVVRLEAVNPVAEMGTATMTGTGLAGVFVDVLSLIPSPSSADSSLRDAGLRVGCAIEGNLRGQAAGPIPGVAASREDLRVMLVADLLHLPHQRP